MSTSTTVSLLNSVLEVSANNAIVETKHGKFIFDAKKFRRNFIKFWLYSEDIGAIPQINSAFGSYVFLLQKNIAVTNLPLPEQVALIRSTVVTSELSSKAGHPKVDFFSTRQYRRYIESVFVWEEKEFGSRLDAIAESTRLIKSFSEFFSDFLLNTIALSHYSTSFVIHVPRSIGINLEKLVAESGYIHSVGYQVYVSRSDRSDKTILIENLNRIRRLGGWEKPIFFAPYCHEFFINEAKFTAYSMENGLEDVKFSARKHYIGNTNLLDLVAEIGDTEGFVTPKTDLYLKEKRDLQGVVENSVSAFLFSDCGVEFSKTSRTLRMSDEHYVLCYMQLLKSSNKLHLIKERKPGWTGPVTIPHTLSSAMINIAKHSAKLDIDRPLIFDPFCGGATFLLDAAIRIPGARLVGVDRHPLFQIMNSDNFSILSNSSAAGQISDLANSAKSAVEASQTSAASREIQRTLSDIVAKNGDLNLVCPPAASAKKKICTAIALVVGELAVSTGTEIMKLTNSEVKDFRDNDSHFSGRLGVVDVQGSQIT
jgi:hypothetical protein